MPYGTVEEHVEGITGLLVLEELIWLLTLVKEEVLLSKLLTYVLVVPVTLTFLKKLSIPLLTFELAKSVSDTTRKHPHSLLNYCLINRPDQKTGLCFRACQRVGFKMMILFSV